MVTLITEQLRKQSLEEPYHKAFSFNVNVVSWIQNLILDTSKTSSTTHPSSEANLLDDSCGLDSRWLPLQCGKPLQRPEVSFTDKGFQSSPPPPPSKRHCRSLSVPEDLSQCRSTWHPSASKVWIPVKRGCQSGGASISGSGASSLPLCHPSSSFTSSSLHSSSSPTFFSLAMSSDSPLPWSFPWDPSPLISRSALHRRFSLSPVHIQDASAVLLPPQPSPSSAVIYGCSALPRCHSQPCDMRKPRLKRRHDSDILPCPRPGLDFSKMTQVSKEIGNRETLVCGKGGCIVPVSSQTEQCFSPAEFPGQAIIGPLSESEEDERRRTAIDGGQKMVFERDCTELDLNLIEEN
uniref:Family with sequence similarity 53 member C n=1 Tax=Monopterus albus TaxID=43700 RepID=A0A3Q3JP33_MONAL